MITVNYSTYQSDLEKYCDKVTDNNEKITITQKNGENLVLMSFAEYNNLIENLFLRSNRANYQHILKGIQQLDKTIRK